MGGKGRGVGGKGVGSRKGGGEWEEGGGGRGVGRGSGKTCSFSPFLFQNNFEEKQRYACPDLFNGVSMQVSDLFWVSTHEFSLVYTPQSGQDVAPNSVFLTTSVSASGGTSQ